MRTERPSAWQGARRNWRILRLAMAMHDDPVAFYRELSGVAVEHLRVRGVPLAGGRWLDAGTGLGAMPEAMAREGASVVAVDLADNRDPEWSTGAFAMARAERLPFAGDSFDGVVSSNVLEHMPDPFAMIGELVRVCRPGGVVYLSWTNWYSPWGGHEMTPLHYLGPRAGLAAYRLLHGRPPAENVPGRTLFVVHVGEVMRALRRSGLEVLDVAPRYWPSLRILARVPGLREVAMWNCAVLIRKPRPRPLAPPQQEPAPAR